VVRVEEALYAALGARVSSQRIETIPTLPLRAEEGE